jgi:hypothetical protein
MKASDAIDYIGVLALATVFVVTGYAIDRAKHPAVPAPPDTAGFWQQANTATDQQCRANVVLSVLSMKLPPEAYADPELESAMQDAYLLCLKNNKVMI